jgi:hypothetical protein
MVSGIVHARYNFPVILVLELEVVKRALISPKKRGSLKMRIKTASCPGIGQVRPISGTFKHVFTQDEPNAEYVPRALLATATAWCGVPDIAADMARRCENPPQGQNHHCPNLLGRRPSSALKVEPCAPHSTTN